MCVIWGKIVSPLDQLIRFDPYPNRLCLLEAQRNETLNHGNLPYFGPTWRMETANFEANNVATRFIERGAKCDAVFSAHPVPGQNKLSRATNTQKKTPILKAVKRMHNAKCRQYKKLPKDCPDPCTVYHRDFLSQPSGGCLLPCESINFNSKP